MRLATLSDLSRAAEICAEAFQQEPIMGYLYPKRDEYPQDWYDYWYYLLQDSILQPGQLLYVLEARKAEKNEVGRNGGVCRRAQIVSVLGWRVVDESYKNPRRLPLEKNSLYECRLTFSISLFTLSV